VVVRKSSLASERQVLIPYCTVADRESALFAQVCVCVGVKVWIQLPASGRRSSKIGAGRERAGCVQTSSSLITGEAREQGHLAILRTRAGQVSRGRLWHFVPVPAGMATYTAAAGPDR